MNICPNTMLDKYGCETQERSQETVLGGLACQEHSNFRITINYTFPADNKWSGMKGCVEIMDSEHTPWTPSQLETGLA